MRSATIILATGLIVGCEQNGNAAKERLEGVWISDREKTLESIERKHSIGDRLKKHLGKMRYEFRDNTIAFYLPGDSRDGEIKRESYSVISENEGSIKIETERGITATFYFEGRCFYVRSSDGFREYFCSQFGI
ncbi:hypothetical protein GWM83_00395 [Candidatus Bathyarchaeota archaeon]|nr:hypothetical protein [Candidatus Bathyarchaeota archaeon]NIW34015.1 hypothetical protein [Candidatus Bathyarchaeota archaeon]